MNEVSEHSSEHYRMTLVGKDREQIEEYLTLCNSCEREGYSGTNWRKEEVSSELYKEIKDSGKVRTFNKETGTLESLL